MKTVALSKLTQIVINLPDPNETFIFYDLSKLGLFICLFVSCFVFVWDGIKRMLMF